MPHRFLAGALAGLMSLGLASAAGAAPRDRLELPDNWQPEGIAAGRDKELFVGSIPTGDIIRLDARTGEAQLAVDAAPGAAAIGLKAVRNRLFVAGGPTGKGFVYNARTGATVKTLTFAPTGPGTFVNDVTLTRKKAYFTDSRRSVLYIVDTRTLRHRELALPDIESTPGAFNLNGIAASADGRTLLAVQSNEKILWRIDARTGDAEPVDLGGYDLANGDGLLLEGRRLYVVQNRSNRIAEFRLARDLRSGRLVGRIESADFSVPTTVARLGKWLYAANARFGVPPTPMTDYWVTRVPR